MTARSLLRSVVLWVCAGGLLAVGCQRFLGIHDSQVAVDDRDGAAGNGSSGGMGGDGPTGLAGGSGGMSAGHGGGSGAAGGAGAHGGGGAAGTLGDGGDMGGAGARAGAGSAGAAADGTAGSAGARGSGGAIGGGNDGGAATGGASAACVAPWHAENVPARLLDPPSGMTACSLPMTAVPTLAAGVDAPNFRSAQACGACIRVNASLGSTSASVVVPIVELSGASGVLLTRAAMDQIAPNASLTNVDWTLVACDVQNQPVHYLIKDGSNAGYVGIQIRNTRYPLASVSVVGSTALVPLTLKSYDYWESTSAGAGPLTLRLTDLNGQSFDDSGINVVAGTEIAGKGQFPVCR